MTIKEIREITGLNKTDFAKQYNIPLRTYHSWERGEREPAPYILELLERVVRYEYQTNKDE